MLFIEPVNIELERKLNLNYVRLAQEYTAFESS